jgi:uracil-DNA glycosylase
MGSEGGRIPAAERREALKELLVQARGCTRCAELAATRKNVVFGAGNADADLMFVGEAPGASEDEQGLPFVGRAGKLLGKLLEEIGLSRDEVFIANTLKCLSYDAPVQLGDGSWERIGRLVRARYTGTVMSVDQSGGLVRRRVTGWHATPLGGRRVFRLTYASAERVGAPDPCVQLTGDHPVLTERGYVPVEQLVPSDRLATGQGMSTLAHDLVCATVLGGGSLTAGPSPLTFSHSHEQAGAFATGPTRVLYDAVEAEDVTDHKRGDTTFFCLDVDETHNFVTAGGVVHNCRPPGNRDPQPIEIDNCHEYLLRQVELIEPSVICSLGNFSTKLLRGDPTGITRLHGQPEIIELGSRAVRLYPIFHPAAALYTPRMLATLREDFARLPELLSLGPPEQPAAAEAPPEPEPEPERTPQPAPHAPPEVPAAPAEIDQLGLF